MMTACHLFSREPQVCLSICTKKGDIYVSCVNWMNIVIGSFLWKNGADVLVIMYAATMWNITLVTSYFPLFRKKVKKPLVLEKVGKNWNQGGQKFYQNLIKLFKIYENFLNPSSYLFIFNKKTRTNTSVFPMDTADNFHFCW